MVLLRYDQASAKVRGLEKEAGKLSSAAKEESRTAGEALKDIAKMERSIPLTLKVEPRNLVTVTNCSPAPSFSPCCCPVTLRKGQKT